MKQIKLISSDLNGTLVHQHTMSDMIHFYIGEEEFCKANAIFKRQTAGTASMEEAFENAGPLTKGLTLRQAIEYTTLNGEMKYLNGFHEFVDLLYKTEIPFVINSTGYGVTIAAIRAQIGKDKIHGSIGNELIFGMDGDSQQELTTEELENKVFAYFVNSEVCASQTYDKIKAVGRVELGISDETAKATLLQTYAQKHFLEIKPEQMLHMGDTMGDSGGIYGVAEAGGVGLAFNYNPALELFLRQKMVVQPELEKRIHFIDRKGKDSDLREILKLL
jgi:hypothetical protein